MDSNNDLEPQKPLNYNEQNGKKYQSKGSKRSNIFISHPKTFIFFAFVVLLAVSLAIILPITLTNKKAVVIVAAKCPDGVNAPKIDCLEKEGQTNQANSQSMCIAKGCCWKPDSDPFTPDCVFPYNLGYKNNRWKENTYSRRWLDLSKIDSQSSYSKMKISYVEAKVEAQTDTRLHIKIYPKRNFKNKDQRWELPSGISNENVFRPLYNAVVTENPFTIKVVRNDTNRIIFDTSKSSLIFADQFLQITTVLSSAYVFGIGEHSKETLMHDMNYKTWPMFASHNHPYGAGERPNLYSQFPMYLNIEPDGHSHLVVFYNSNPSEIFLTPYPSLTYRSTGGIFDIYIFMGPTPVQAIAQFQQAFGLPRLPPYWSLGLHLGVENYGNLENMKSFVKSFKNASLPFDLVSIGTEYMENSAMFTLNSNFRALSTYVDELRHENRTAIVKFMPAIVNSSLNYPYTDGTTNTKIWILENFFTAPYTGKLFGRNVVYPDFSMGATKDWWREALNRFILKDDNVKLDGVFLDYLEPLNQNVDKECRNNKWNLPFYKPKAIKENLYNYTLCMDARHINSKHFNVHGAYSHFMISATESALDTLAHNRSFILTRNAFIGSGKYSAKYLGEYNSDWYNFKRFVIALIEMPMFGFNMVGGDVCGLNGEYEYDLCSNWIKLGGLSPIMRLHFRNFTDNGHLKFLQRDFFEVLNATLHLRYSLIPYFYTQLYHATASGIIPIRPLAFQYPNDTKTYKIDNQFLWGDKLLVTAGTESGNVFRTYLPEGVWYDYYRGSKRESNGDFIEVQTSPNTTALHIRGGSVMIVQEAKLTAEASRITFADIIIALDNNFTATGDFFVDDINRRTSLKRENYHRLTDFKVYREGDYGIVEVKRLKGRYRTELAYRNLIVYGLLSQPKRITVNEDSNPIDPYRTFWDPIYNVYKANLQTEQKKKVLVDNEYLSFKWYGGFVQTNNQIIQ